MKGLLFTLIVVAGAAGSAVAQSGSADSSFSFAVLGHVRGNKEGELNPKLSELLGRVRTLDPDFVVLTGDMIWGEVDNDPVDTTAVLREWHELDSALATLGVPVYRVPGNHDISDIPSRDIYFRLYGEPPQAFDYEGSRFLLLASAWIPEDGDLRHNPFIRTRSLTEEQTDWLRQRLSDTTEYQNAFVFIHHLLWWEPDSSQWWREVHPILAAGGVDAVFSGDYGPMKFSELERDGVQYLQSSIEGDPSLGVLHAFETSRMLSSQFDNFFYVTVEGDSVEVEVKTLAEFSSDHFTPEKYRAVMAPARESQTLAGRLKRMFSPKRIVAGLLLLGAGLAVGFVAGRRTGSRQ